MLHVVNVMWMVRCVVAIKYNADNIKAYYRKATALKAMRMYERAMHAAEQGRRQATSRPKEVSNLEADRISFSFSAPKKTIFYILVFYFSAEKEVHTFGIFYFSVKKILFSAVKGAENGPLQLQLREIYVKPKGSMRPAKSVALSTLLRQLICIS